MDRRQFIRTSALAGIALGVEGPAIAAPTAKKAEKKAVEPRGNAKARIGILSDIHIIGRDSTDLFKKALLHFRSLGVDGVIVAGDMADWGTEEQLGFVQEVWESVFPAGKGEDGRPVTQLFVTGNHDLTVPTNKRVKHLGLPLDGFFVNHKEEMWERVFHEPYKPIWKKEVCGYTFIGAQFDNKLNVPGLEEFMASAGVEGDKPFFYIQHTHPKGTCSAPWAWGQDDGASTAILSRFPNCISFTGHSHTSLTDERTIWQGSFISVGTASLRYILPFGGRENSKVCNSTEKVPSQMKVHNFDDGQQGQLMTIYDNCITLDRIEFARLDALGTWTIPLPLTGKPCTFEQRGIKSVAPQFAEGASVYVTEATGEDRYGKAEHQFTVHFPAAAPSEARAYDYEVCVEMEDIDTVKTICTKRVFSHGYHLAAYRDTGEVQCVFKTGELCDYRRFRFAARPCNCFGVKGEPVFSDWMTLA